MQEEISKPQGNLLNPKEACRGENPLGKSNSPMHDIPPFDSVNKKGGAFLIARKLFDSELWISKPSSWLKIWVYILGRVNHADDKINKRGEGFFRWTVEIERLGKDITPDVIKKSTSFFKKNGIISTRRSTRGVHIKVLKYNEYQELDNYSSTGSGTKKALRKHQESTTIDKNVKNEKNVNSSKADALQGKMWNELIDLFEPINPMFTDIYKNTTERNALSDLTIKIGFDKLKSLLQHLPEIVSRKYAPKITKPTELKRDLGKLILFIKQEQNNGNGEKINKRGVIL